MKKVFPNKSFVFRNGWTPFFCENTINNTFGVGRATVLSDYCDDITNVIHSVNGNSQ